MPKGKIVLIVAHEGYQQTEYNVPKKILRDAEFDIVTASNKSGNAIAKDGSTTEVDIKVSEINPQDYDAIVFIGGPGALENLDDSTSYELLKKTNKLEKIIGAISIATRILAKSGILEGKKATGFDRDGELGKIFEDHNVEYASEEVVTDQNIVTAVGPDQAKEFAEQIINAYNSTKSWG